MVPLLYKQIFIQNLGFASSKVRILSTITIPTPVL